MPPEQTLVQRVRELAKRLTLLRAQTFLARTLLVGLTVTILLGIAHKLYLLTCPWWLFAMLLTLSAAAGATWSYLNRASPFEAALETDTKLGLKERLSSALALLALSQKDPMVAALVHDASKQAAGVDPKKLYPQKLSRDLKLTALAAMLAGAVAFMPPMEFLRTPLERAISRALKFEGKRLKKEAKKVERVAVEQKLPQSKEAAAKVAKLAALMESQRLAKKEAMLKMQKLTDELKKQHELMAKQLQTPDASKMEKAITAAQVETELAKEAVEALKERKDLEALERQLKKLWREIQKQRRGQFSEEERKKLDAEMKKMAADLQRMQQAMQKLQSQLGQLPQDLLEKLAKLAQAIQQQGVQLDPKALEEVMKALQNMKLTQKDIEELRKLLENLDLSNLKLAQADKPCDACKGTGKG